MHQLDVNFDVKIDIELDNELALKLANDLGVKLDVKPGVKLIDIGVKAGADFVPLFLVMHKNLLVLVVVGDHLLHRVDILLVLLTVLIDLLVQCLHQLPIIHGGCVWVFVELGRLSTVSGGLLKLGQQSVQGLDRREVGFVDRGTLEAYES